MANTDDPKDSKGSKSSKGPKDSKDSKDLKKSKDSNGFDESQDFSDGPSDSDLFGQNNDKELNDKELNDQDKKSGPVSGLIKLFGILIFITVLFFAGLTVYMKYSGNCNILGSLYGSLICRDKSSKTFIDTLKDMFPKQAQKVEEKVKKVEEKIKGVESKVKTVAKGGSSTFNAKKYNDSFETFDTPALLIANNKLTITSLRSSKVKSLPHKDGQIFSKDDILVIFDCRELELDYAVQKAVAAEKRASLENLKKLQSLKSANQFSVVEAASQLEQAERLIDKMEYQLSYCVIKAEYSGKVINTNITESEYANAGQDVMTVNNNKDLLVKAYVQADWLDWLTVGTIFKLCVGEKQCFKGVVHRIGAEVDATSQTIDVFGKLTDSDPDNRLIAGLSGQVTFIKS